MKLLKFLMVLAIPILFSGCMSIVYFKGGTAVSEKSLPKEIKSIVLVNRTLPEFNIFHTIATGTINADRPGITECLNGLFAGLIQNNFYDVKKDVKRHRSPQSASFPPPLLGIEIQNICKQFNTDALLSLEIFDIKTNFTYQPGVKIQMDNAGKDYPINIITAIQETTISAGWRVYNGNDTTIADEYKTERKLLWKADGINEINASSKLPLLSIELPKLGSEMGYTYAHHISPKTEIIGRQYYGKENDELKRAKAFIKSGNWDGAKNIWLEQANRSDNKTSSRATYNLAIYYEKQRDVNAALELAQKACSLDKNKYTTLYVQLLQIIKNQN